VELGLGFLLPYFMLLVIGVDPAVAGLALIPATVPIVLAGPLAGRAFDRVGGRVPLVAGYVLLAGSGLALGLEAGAESVGALVPGLVWLLFAARNLISLGGRRSRPGWC
jgi:MFS family permease